MLITRNEYLPLFHTKTHIIAEHWMATQTHTYMWLLKKEKKKKTLKDDEKKKTR